MTEQVKEEGIIEENKLDVETDINAIFSGEGLSEEFKTNAKVIFEAAITAKVEEAKIALEEEYAT